MSSLVLLACSSVLVGLKIIIIIIIIIIITFSQLPLSHWVQSMRRVVFSFLNSVGSLLISRATTEKSAFYFSDSPF